MLELNWPQLNI